MLRWRLCEDRLLWPLTVRRGLDGGLTCLHGRGGGGSGGRQRGLGEGARGRKRGVLGGVGMGINTDHLGIDWQAGGRKQDRAASIPHRRGPRRGTNGSANPREVALRHGSLPGALQSAALLGLAGDPEKVLLGVGADLSGVSATDVARNGPDILGTKLLQGLKKPLVLVWGPISALDLWGIRLQPILLILGQFQTQALNLGTRLVQVCFQPCKLCSSSIASIIIGWDRGRGMMDGSMGGE